MKSLAWLLAWMMGIAAVANGQTANNDAPRLVVVVSLDQFRADYLTRFAPYFCEGGFARLLRDGAVYTDCHHRHATTTTANGHATLITGVHANVHGIINNEWLDPVTLIKSTSVADSEAPIVGAALSAVRVPAVVLGDDLGASPRRLLASTVGDQMKLRWGAATKIVSMANKDRVAILLGGHAADAAYWVLGSRVVTSSFYRERLPDWVERFNQSGPVDKDFGREWTRLLDAKIYDAVQGPDDFKGEDNPSGLGVTFPHIVNGGAKTLTPAFYDAHRISPFATELLANLAKRAVQEEQLGKHSAPDLLCLGFSQTDTCGHSYGPDSHEMMDSVLRLDRVLADLLGFLDQEVGTGRYLVVLSSDHGVCPLPERVQAYVREIPSGRFKIASARAKIEEALNARFGAVRGGYWTVQDSTGFRFRPETLKEKGVTAAQAAPVVKSVLLQFPQIASVFTREDLLNPPNPGDPIEAAVRLSYNFARSQDVVFVFKPYFIDRQNSGTTHGTPYDYDNHVPLIWCGPGIPAGVHSERVGTDQVAPTLCSILRLPRPPQAVAAPLF